MIIDLFIRLLEILGRARIGVAVHKNDSVSVSVSGSVTFSVSVRECIRKPAPQQIPTFMVRGCLPRMGYYVALQDYYLCPLC
jgi:hypothetical protein